MKRTFQHHQIMKKRTYSTRSNHILITALIKMYKCIDGPFNSRKGIHFYYRIEFQQRCFLHAHILLVQLFNAPTFNSFNDLSIYFYNFIDEVNTCKNDWNKNYGMPKCIQFQKYIHTNDTLSYIKINLNKIKFWIGTTFFLWILQK